MHSIFMLRCFNDCFAVLFFWLAIYCYQRNQWHLGSALYSTGLNVKMSLLLPLPAMGILMVMKLGGREALTQAMIIGQISVRISSHFHIYHFSIGIDQFVGPVWVSLQKARTQLLCSRFRTQPCLPLQVDRELALRPRINIPLPAFRHRPTRSPCWPPCLVCANPLDQAFEAQCPRVPQTLYSSH